MHAQRQTIAALILVAGLGSALSGCVVEPRYYDPAFRDYHRWNAEEAGFYSRYWEERRQPYREYRALSEEQQRDYWNWRHGYKSRDHEEHHDREAR